MFKRNLALLLSLLFVLTAVGLSFALGDGNYRKGKYLYRKHCRTCHDGGKAKELSPLTYTQAKWAKLFDPANRDGIKCKDEWVKLKRKDQDINDIYTYLWKHAKDSPTPAKCK